MGEMSSQPVGRYRSGADGRYAGIYMSHMSYNQSNRVLLGSKGGARRCGRREMICGHWKAWHRLLVSAAKEETVSQTEKFIESLEAEEENLVVGENGVLDLGREEKQEVCLVCLS